MKLSDVEEGTYVIKSVSSTRLLELGFVPGREIEVQVNRGNRLVVVIMGEKFAIAKELAEGVEVDQGSLRG